MSKFFSLSFNKYAGAIAVAALIAGAAGARAEVVFEFTYADVETNATHGFNDTTPYPDGSGRDYGKVRRDNTEAAARRLGALFRNSATVTVYVTSTQDPELLGSCGSDATGGNNPGFVRSVMAKKIIEGIDDNGEDPDGELSMNFMDTTDPEWAYGDTIATNQYDFQDTLIHELTHALGYLNAVMPGGGGLLEGLDPFSPQKWYYWDNFLADADTNRLVNASTFVFDADQLPTLTNHSLFFHGVNAMQGNNGKMVQIYAPTPWGEGSSAAHIDTNYPPLTTMFWIGSHGRGSRGYAPAESGIMVDLGYDMLDPSGPANLAASTGLADEVALTWQAPAYSSPALSNVVGYAVYRGVTTSSADAVAIADLGAGVLSYDDAAVTPGVAYYYWVRAKYNNVVPQTSLMRTSVRGYAGTDPDPDPELGPSVRANGQRGTVTVAHPGTVSVTVTLKPGAYAGQEADWWGIAVPNYGADWYFLDATMNWRTFPAGSLGACTPAHQGPLFHVANPVTILPATTLPVGQYTVYFSVDQRDGIINHPHALTDMVTVIVE